ncbi:periplasmic protein TonB, links inner and outer membranes [Serpentinimonas raichei]|uniref:Periplasmic protein TonB, links inner and outer membranes n=1 Tax=Serpentinimonas raichei TaxID=1458425 RepID=A0A060NR79_9BURK|nr:periplasmic protein TonB, links inner and outer membranes [Serpentinimonas raichei]
MRPVSVTAAVLLAHVAALWAFHSGWRPPAPAGVGVVRVEVELRAQASGVAATAPAPAPAASAPNGAAPRAAPERPSRPEPPRPEPPRPPAPRPTPIQPAPASPSPASERVPQAAPAPPSPQGAAAAEASPQQTLHNAAPSHALPGSAASAQGSSAAAQGSTEAAAGRAPAAPAAPAAPQIVLPSSSAAHLHNPAPAYPVLSRRLGEQGRVLLRVRIEADGSASAAQIYASSGFVRLDQAAQQAVLRWRFVPGTRNGEAQAMWFLVPIHFVLE